MVNTYKFIIKPLYDMPAGTLVFFGRILEVDLFSTFDNPTILVENNYQKITLELDEPDAVIFKISGIPDEFTSRFYVDPHETAL